MTIHFPDSYWSNPACGDVVRSSLGSNLCCIEHATFVHLDWPGVRLPVPAAEMTSSTRQRTPGNSAWGVSNCGSIGTTIQNVRRAVSDRSRVAGSYSSITVEQDEVPKPVASVISLSRQRELVQESQLPLPIRAPPFARYLDPPCSKKE